MGSGVCWIKHMNRWGADIIFKKQHKKSYHANELEAARRVNQYCDEFGINRRNPDVDSMPNKGEDSKTLLNYGALKTEFEDLIKVLDANKDSAAALSIRKILIAAIRYEHETEKTELNFKQTKNFKLALSIAAKHGFSKVVKFLISQGANKEHVDNEHHTPLSLAVSHNHLKVVEVLFENWISPNSHEEPYLHLSPIFNVKSREIAQLLVDNDAVTDGIYNNKNQSPLTIACQNGFLDVVEFFLDDGLDINHVDSDNKTPLFYALKNAHHDVVNLLISRGAQNKDTN